MRAIGVRQFGDESDLEVLDLPSPEPGSGEVRIRVHYATVNPTDTNVVRGVYGEEMQGAVGPWVPGMDVAGEIDAVGDGVADFAVGDRVMAVVSPSGTHGGYAEQVVVPALSTAPVPDGIGLDAASTLPMNGLTAQVSLQDLALSEGDVLAVTGAAGCYGGYVVQLAKTRGITVVADAKDDDVELVRSLGADEVLERGAQFASRVREGHPDGVDGLADGSVQHGEVADAVKDGGRMAVIRPYADDPGRGVDVHATWVFDHVTRQDWLRELAHLAAQGDLTLRVNRVMPAEDAAEAHRLLAGGGLRGRLVLDLR